MELENNRGMKTICIVKDERPFWTEIESYLKTVNARVIPLDLRAVLKDISEKNPDIVIAGERALRELAGISQNIPKLVITEGDVAESKSKDVFFLKWTTTKEPFLELTSRLLYISERRIFKTVITIYHKGRNDTFLGKSLNFSLSGMAIKVDRPLDSGDILSISFFIPNSDNRISIDAEVMRKSVDLDGSFVYYGVRFIDLDDRIKDMLEGFIKKIK
jgi:hypothetical protein